MDKGFRGDPTARRRRSRDEALADAQQVIRRHFPVTGKGESVRDIAAALGLSRNTVHRVIQEYRAAQAKAGEDELDSEAAALVAKYGRGGGLRWEDMTSADQIDQLNDLEYYRLRYSPLDHPVRALLGEAIMLGPWRPLVAHAAAATLTPLMIRPPR